MHGTDSGFRLWPDLVLISTSPLRCFRSRFIVALREAGPEAERTANAALEAGRAFLDRVVEDALADVPLTSVEMDSEIDAIQVLRLGGQRS